jgi:hypothetical protein
MRDGDEDSLPCDVRRIRRAQDAVLQHQEGPAVEDRAADGVFNLVVGSRPTCSRISSTAV